MYADNFQIKYIGDEDNSFPIINSQTNPAKKINLYLQNQLLFKQIKIKNEKNDFDEAFKKYVIPNLQEIYINNNKIFSLSFIVSATGNENIVYFNFNAQNGENITIKNLFSDVGYKMIYDRYNKYLISRYDKMINYLGGLEEYDCQAGIAKERLIECRDEIDDIYDFFFERG